jgi:hypothetical protein
VAKHSSGRSAGDDSCWANALPPLHGQSAWFGWSRRRFCLGKLLIATDKVALRFLVHLAIGRLLAAVACQQHRPQTGWRSLGKGIISTQRPSRLSRLVRLGNATLGGSGARKSGEHQPLSRLLLASPKRQHVACRSCGLGARGSFVASSEGSSGCLLIASVFFRLRALGLWEAGTEEMGVGHPTTFLFMGPDLAAWNRVSRHSFNHVLEFLHSEFSTSIGVFGMSTPTPPAMSVPSRVESDA